MFAKMSSTCVTPVFALILCFAAAGPVPRSECVLSPVNNSHPVHALLESFTVLSGCASRGTTGLPQEVHVLNLRNPEEGLGHHEREVTLHLNPISSVHIHQKPLVFLLNSPLPLHWKLKTERLAPGIQRVFFQKQKKSFFLRKMNICYSGPRRNMEQLHLSPNSKYQETSILK